MKKPLTAILFFGAAWGFCEATVGFALHRAAVLLPGLPGALMFPVGYFWMTRAQRSTSCASAALSAALVAASVKLVDFLAPGADPVRVVGPALSILLEGLAVALLTAPEGEERHFLVPRLFGMGVLWRALFALYLFAISLFGLPAGLVTGGASRFLRFLLAESALNAVVIAAWMAAAQRLPRMRPLPIGPGAAWAACLIALIAHAAL